MELEEIRKKKEELETTIYNALQKFQQETDIKVLSVDINKIFGGSEEKGYLVGVHADIRL